MRSTGKEAWERAIKATQSLLALTLIGSATLAVWVVTTDNWLRAVAPSHEYGLLAFAILDILLSMIVFATPRIADAGAFTAALFQVTAMLGDAFTFAPAGTTQAEFRAYLLGDVGFVALLAIQLALAGITTLEGALLYGSRRKMHTIEPSRLPLAR